MSKLIDGWIEREARRIKKAEACERAVYENLGLDMYREKAMDCLIAAVAMAPLLLGVLLEFSPWKGSWSFCVMIFGVIMMAHGLVARPFARMLKHWWSRRGVRTAP